jgi:site-specific DNA recombinase
MGKMRRRAESLPNVGASYNRYSSDNQHQESIADQRRCNREAAARDGTPIADELQFDDHATSGTRQARDGLDRMMAAARAGLFATLFVVNLSRLARELVLSLPLLKELVHVLNVRVVSVQESIDSRRGGWEFMAAIYGLQHEQYLRDLRQYVLNGQEGVVLSGYSVGDYCFGYGSEPVAGTEASRRGRHRKPRMQYTIHEVNARWVVLIFTWFAIEKWSMRQIARELTWLKAPKDHRSTTTSWHPDQVRKVLGNAKYIGRWPWGENTNRRNPLDGSIIQEPRDPEECAKWLRDLPKLRILGDPLWDATQARLLEVGEKFSGPRNRDGQLYGGSASAAAAYPRHLLEGLLRCSACGAVAHVAGASGQYLVCSGYKTGLCGRATGVPRARAERMILAAISSRILSDSRWHVEVLAELEAERRRLDAWQPARLKDVRREIGEVDCKIANLVDKVEAGGADPAIPERLAKRRAERRTLGQEEEKLVRAEKRTVSAPTASWVSERFGRLEAVLNSGGPAAALALGDLVGGRIEVDVEEVPGRERHHARLRLRIATVAVARQAAGLPLTADLGVGSVETAAEEIVIELREPTDAEGRADAVKKRQDDGESIKAIGEAMGLTRAQVDKALTAWYKCRGLEKPDGRAGRANRPEAVVPIYVQIVDEVKRLSDQGGLLLEIGDELGVDRDKVTRAIAHWHSSRGLAVPDGRTRRKGLERKVSRPGRRAEERGADDSPKDS